MRHSILYTLVGAAAVLTLPMASWAEDVAPAPSAGIRSDSTGAAQPTQGSADEAFKSGGTFSNEPQAGPASGGVMVHEGTAYIIHRLQSEMSLPDGSKIKPNGTIEGKDGSLRQVGENQMLSLDGRMLDSPFGSSSSSDTTPSTQTESPALGAPGTSSPRTDGSVTAPGSTTEASSPATGQPSSPGISTSTDPSYSSPGTSASSPQTGTADPAAPASRDPFTPGSSPTVSPEPPNPLNSTAPGSGLQDTSPLSSDPAANPSTDSSSTEPFRDSKSPTAAEPISTDPTRDKLD